MDISQFKTDIQLEANGVWVDVGKGTKLCVARMYNPRHKDALRAALKPYKRQIQFDAMDDELGDEIVVGIMAQTILLGWEGMTENGEAVPYSYDKAVEFLKIKDFRDLVIEIASTMESYRAQATEDDEKN
jgi:nitric oxide synthase oxygenase domain/subunit